MAIVYTYRDTMPHNSIIPGGELDTLFETLGIKKEDLERMMKNDPMQTQPYFSNGPWNDPPYWASYYGTISIKDF